MRRILISGATGLVGQALAEMLRGSDHEVWQLGRRKSDSTNTLAAGLSIHWDIDQRQLDAEQLEDFDAVVHLAGESIASGRWTSAKKERIRHSRVAGTQLLAERLAACQRRPRVLLCASAIGYYGDRGPESLDEQSPAGRGFLAEVCQAWEAAAEPARAAGIRVVHLRFGVILSTQGGALAKMLLPFRLGLGGKIGSGHQYMSWITLDDTLRATIHAMQHDTLSGAVNVVAPAAVTNGEFTKALGRALGRPTIFPMPALAARLAFGEMANELLLASTRVVPRQLDESGFEFSHPRLDAALTHVLRS